MLVFIITIILLSIQFPTFPNTKGKTKTETWYDKNLLKKFSKWNFTFKGNRIFSFSPVLPELWLLSDTVNLRTETPEKMYFTLTCLEGASMSSTWVQRPKLTFIMAPNSPLVKHTADILSKGSQHMLRKCCLSLPFSVLPSQPGAQCPATSSYRTATNLRPKQQKKENCMKSQVKNRIICRVQGRYLNST